MTEKISYKILTFFFFLFSMCNHLALAEIGPISNTSENNQRVKEIVGKLPEIILSSNEVVEFLEHHDPYMLYLQVDGNMHYIEYDFDWEKIDALKSGSPLIFVWSSREGPLLIQKKYGFKIPISSGFGFHPIDEFQSNCFSKPDNEKSGMCLQKVFQYWQLEMDRLLSLSNVETKKAQILWLLYKKKQIDIINSHFSSTENYKALTTVIMLYKHRIQELSGH